MLLRWKKIFESVYEDIGVTCEQVGGLLSDTGDYYEGMEPCKTECADKPQGNGKFVLPGMGLEVKCGELSSLDAISKEFMCATEEGAATCPSTCTGDCACMDNKDASFTKKNGEEGTCADIALIGFGKSGNGTRRKFCNKEKEARSTCPVSRIELYAISLSIFYFLTFVILLSFALRLGYMQRMVLL